MGISTQGVMLALIKFLFGSISGFFLIRGVQACCKVRYLHGDWVMEPLPWTGTLVLEWEGHDFVIKTH